MARDVFLIGLGIVIGLAVAFLFLIPANAHGRKLVTVNSPWAYSGCSGEALEPRYIRWTCEVSE